MDTVPSFSSRPYTPRPSAGHYQQSNFLLSMVKVIDSIPSVLLRALRFLFPRCLHLTLLRLALWLPGVTDDSPPLAGRIARYVNLKRGLPPPPFLLPQTQGNIASSVGLRTRSPVVHTFSTTVFPSLPSPPRCNDSVLPRSSPFPPPPAPPPTSAPGSSEISSYLSTSWSSHAPQTPSSLSSGLFASPKSAVAQYVPLNPPDLSVPPHLQYFPESDEIEAVSSSDGQTPVPHHYDPVNTQPSELIYETGPREEKGKQRAENLHSAGRFSYAGLHPQPEAPIAGPSTLTPDISLMAPGSYAEHSVPKRHYEYTEHDLPSLCAPGVPFVQSPQQTELSLVSQQAEVGDYLGGPSSDIYSPWSHAVPRKIAVDSIGWPISEARDSDLRPSTPHIPIQNPPIPRGSTLPAPAGPLEHRCSIPENLTFMGYHFEIKGQIGVGGFGRVLAANLHDLSHSVPCAIKVICKRKQYGGFWSNGREGIFRELEVMAMADMRRMGFLNRLCMSWDDFEHVYYVMPLHKQDLGSWIYYNKSTPYFYERVPVITAQLIHGLNQLWTLGFLHCDLKPQNILEDQTGHFIICDFGLALPITHGPTNRIGSTAYTPPEVLLDAYRDSRQVQYTPASDIWSLGLVLLEMHLGIAEPYFAPCRTYTSRDIERYVLEGEIDTRGVRDPDAADLLQRMLRKRPEERLTMSEILTHPYLTKRSSSLALADHIRTNRSPSVGIPHLRPLPLECSAINSPHYSPAAVQEGLAKDIRDKHAFCYISRGLYSAC